MLFKGIEPDGHIAKMLTIPEEGCYSTSSNESNTSSQKRTLSLTDSSSPTSCKKVCLDEGIATSGDSSNNYFKAIATKNNNDKKKRVKDADHSSSETSTGFTQTNTKKDHALQLLKDNVEKAKLRANEVSSSDEMR